MGNFPPEKYYEACITHHLVNEFKERYDRLLYPFSISQIEENSKGFDFGYTFSSKSFYIQYKRPFSFEVVDSKCSWQIDKTQLSVINSQSYALQTYYALPAFINTNLWFSGIDNTYFIESNRLAFSLKQNQNKKETKTNIVHSSLKSLRIWSDFSSRFSSTLQNTIVQEQQEFNFQEIINYAKILDQNTRNQTWVYLLEVR